MLLLHILLSMSANAEAPTSSWAVPAEPAPTLSSVMGTHKEGTPGEDGVSGTLVIKAVGAGRISVGLSSSYQHASTDNFYECGLEGVGAWQGKNEVLASGFKSGDCAWSLVYKAGKFWPEPVTGSDEACSLFCGGMGHASVDMVRFKLPKTKAPQ